MNEIDFHVAIQTNRLTHGQPDGQTDIQVDKEMKTNRWTIGLTDKRERQTRARIKVTGREKERGSSFSLSWDWKLNKGLEIRKGSLLRGRHSKVLQGAYQTFVYILQTEDPSGDNRGGMKRKEVATQGQVTLVIINSFLKVYFVFRTIRQLLTHCLIYHWEKEITYTNHRSLASPMRILNIYVSKICEVGILCC